MKVGVLAPQSKAYPRIGKELVNSIKLGFGDAKDLELVIEDVGFGANEDVVMEKVQRLTLQHDVDIVVGVLSTMFMELVVEHFDSQEQPLIVCNLGGHMPFKRYTSPYVFYNSMQLWRSLWALGTYAAEAYGKKAAISNAFYEAGYHLFTGFDSGYTRAGGAFESIQITPAFTDPDTTQLKDWKTHLDEVGPDFILGLYHTKDAATFLKTYQETGVIDQYPLLTLGTMVEEALLPHQALTKPEQIHSVASWCLNDPQTDQTYTKAYQESAGKQPGPYGILGYELGLQLKQLGDKLAGTTPNPQRIIETLKTVQIDGPRGMLSFDETLQETTPRHYLRRLVQQEDGTYQNRIVKELPDPEQVVEEVKKAGDTVNSGWFNPYLCV